MKRILSYLLCLTLAWGNALPVWAAVDIAQTPIDGISNVKPNIVFGMDDSGSMDFEVMLGTNDGALWWDSTSKTGWNAQGVPHFNLSGVTGNSGGGNWSKHVYLFPNGCGTDTRKLCDSSGHYGIAPTPQFAWTRSAAFNPMFYDPQRTYDPWAPGVISGASRSFSDATPMATRSHPVFNGTTQNLSAAVNSTASNWTFTMYPGMVVPGAQIPGIRVYRSGAWANQTTTITLTATTQVSIPYFPATYYVPSNCALDGVSCVSAPDGSRLKRYEIKAGETFPTGRSYEQELQNFANWFQFHRKRKLMLAGSMGSVLTGLTNVRAGVAEFNDRPANITMYDFASAAATSGSQAVIGRFYANPSSGGTPTRQTLNYIGQQYMNNRSLVQYACQRNAAFLVTDGFADATAVAPPAYNKARWGNPAPLGVPYANTLADLALGYFTLNLRPDLTPGRVPFDSQNTSPSADRNPDPHLNTYSITLGARGTVYPYGQDPFANPPTWPNPNANRSPTAVDDLWLATLNGRGQMLTATNTSNLTQQIQDVINDILFKSGAQGAVGLANPNLSESNNSTYWASYNGRGWFGDLSKSTVNLTTGIVSNTPTWSAADQLTNRDWTTRRIGSFNGNAGVPFTAASVGARIAPVPAGTTGQLVNWLRGDRSEEGTLFRTRVKVLGDVVNAEPVASPDGSVVYVAANDGMLHAFDANTGAELWAYVPGLVHDVLGNLAAKTYSHRFFVDAAPSVEKLDNGKTLLVGGLRAGGSGFYALDVSNAAASTDADVAAKVLWEFPKSGTPASLRAKIGLSYAKPAIVKTANHGWVVLVSSGYNPGGDGQGRVFMLNAMTGDLVREFATGVDADIGALSVFVNRTGAAPMAEYAYAGDLAGNLWRFDLAAGSVSRVATLRDAGGAAQPITTAPELTTIKGMRLILVGTGKLLGLSDFSPTQTQSVYAITDTGTPVTNVRTALEQRTLVVSGSSRTLNAAAPDWIAKRGWFFDLPAGEVANTDSQLGQGALWFTSNKPDRTACSSESYLYVVDVATGSQRPNDTFVGQPWTGTQLGPVLAAKPVLAQLPDGSMIALTHKMDNTIDTRRMLPPRNPNPRRAAWREVLR